MEHLNNAARVDARPHYAQPIFPINDANPPEQTIEPADPQIGRSLDAGAVAEYSQYMATLACLQSEVTEWLAVLHLHRQVCFELTRRGMSAAKIAEYTADARGWIDAVHALSTRRPQAGQAAP